MPTLIRWPRGDAAGNTDIVEQCMKNCQLGTKSFHVHLDDYNLIPFFKGEGKNSPRKEFLYWSDDGDLFALRVGRWQTVFSQQNIWMKDYEKLRIPKIFDLRAHPFERGDFFFLV